MPRKGTRQLWADKLMGKSTESKRSKRLPGNSAPFKGSVLGIDPSLRGTGLAVVEILGPDRRTLLHSRTVRIEPSVSMFECLGRISENVSEIMNTHSIDAVAVEQTIYVQNFQTAQVLGAARGAAIAAAAVLGKPIFEYAPLRVKQAVVGVGRASKEQVARTVMGLMGMSDALEHDQSDAAAVALCHAFTS
jgi:crossover junction endodeoxyribonuclease RuvC